MAAHHGGIHRLWTERADADAPRCQGRRDGERKVDQASFSCCIGRIHRHWKQPASRSREQNNACKELQRLVRCGAPLCLCAFC